MAALPLRFPKVSAPDGESLADRIAAREFPSVFQSWNPADNLPHEQPLDTAARHDLLWNLPEYFGLRWNSPYRLLGDAFQSGTVESGLGMRAALIARNRSMVLLSEVRWHDSPTSDLPDTSGWWQRDSSGQRVVGWEKGNQYLLDWHSSDFRAWVAQQAAVIAGSGVVDGILLDWWSDETDDLDRLRLLQEVRQAIGPDALILVNAGWTSPITSAPYINGLYMETTIPRSTREGEEWQRATATLDWAERNLRMPTLNAFETWTCVASPACAAEGRANMNRMRATTTLVLTHSSGYALFADPTGLPTPDHLHNWYPFWDRSLGHPRAEGIARSDGATQREFDNGTVVYNPIDNQPVLVTFDKPRRSSANGQRATSFVLDTFDGDLYLAP